MSKDKYKLPSCRVFRGRFNAFIAFIFASEESIDIHVKMLGFHDSVYIVHLVSILERQGAHMFFLPLKDGSFLFRLSNVDPLAFDVLYRTIKPE